jgi:hypothetical protein
MLGQREAFAAEDVGIAATGEAPCWIAAASISECDWRGVAAMSREQAGTCDEQQGKLLG